MLANLFSTIFRSNVSLECPSYANIEPWRMFHAIYQPEQWHLKQLREQLAFMEKRRMSFCIVHSLLCIGDSLVWSRLCQQPGLQCHVWYEGNGKDVAAAFL